MKRNIIWSRGIRIGGLTDLDLDEFKKGFCLSLKQSDIPLEDGTQYKHRDVVGESCNKKLGFLSGAK